MGSTAKTEIASAIALDTDYASVGTLNVSMFDFVTIGWDVTSSATVQSVEAQFEVAGAKLVASETGLANGEMAAVTVSVPMADLDGAAFRMDVFAIDSLEILLRVDGTTRTLNSVWVVGEASSSRTLTPSSVSFTPAS